MINREDIRSRFEALVRDALDDEELCVKEDTSAADVPGWDSLAHINIVVAAEKAFGIRFASAEIAALKKPGQNVGSFLDLIAGKLDSAKDA